MQSIRRSVECANSIFDITNSNYTTMQRCYTRDNLTFIYAVPDATRTNWNDKYKFSSNVSSEKGPKPQKGVGTPFLPHYTSGFQPFWTATHIPTHYGPATPRKTRIKQKVHKMSTLDPRLKTIDLYQWSSTFFVQSPPLQELYNFLFSALRHVPSSDPLARHNRIVPWQTLNYVMWSTRRSILVPHVAFSVA